MGTTPHHSLGLQCCLDFPSKGAMGCGGWEGARIATASPDPPAPLSHWPRTDQGERGHSLDAKVDPRGSSGCLPTTLCRRFSPRKNGTFPLWPLQLDQPTFMYQSLSISAYIQIYGISSYTSRIYPKNLNIFIHFRRKSRRIHQVTC